MRALANPVVLRALAVFVCSTFSFLLGWFLVRTLRHQISEEADISADAGPSSLETLPLHTFSTVIQQLKQQKQELLVQSQAEQQRARTSENFSQAVLSNLSCGVLVFGTNGLVNISNPASKAILGFACTTGMSAADIFRASSSRSAHTSASAESTGDGIPVADEITSVLHEGGKGREVEAEYQTPAGEKRFISMTISPVSALDGTLLGVACVIDDRTELEVIRQHQALHGEISAEMALRLRASLRTIAGYAEQLGTNSDGAAAEQLATDISHELADLDRSLGGFLTSKDMAEAAGA